MSNGFSKPDPLVTMTNLEFRVWGMRERATAVIAHATGKSEGVVSRAYSRALDKWREQMARQRRAEVAAFDPSI